MERFQRPFAVGNAPDASRAILAAGQQSMPGSTESNTRHPIVVPQAWADRESGNDIPDTGGAVAAGGGQEFIIGAEGDCQYGTIVQQDDGGDSPSGRFPEMDDTVLTRRRQPSAIRAEHSSIHSTGVLEFVGQ